MEFHTGKITALQMPTFIAPIVTVMARDICYQHNYTIIVGISLVYDRFPLNLL
jgi:hypothetical protein